MSVSVTNGDIIEADGSEDQFVIVSKDDWDELQDQLERIEEELQNQSRNVSGAFTKLGEIEDRLEAAEADCQENTPGAQGGETASQEAENDTEHQTPLEQILSMPQDVIEENLTANQRRASFIAEDVENYGESVPAGVRVDSTSMRRVLSAASDEAERIYRTTTKRVMDFLNRFGSDEISVKKRHGKRFVVMSDELVERIKKLKQNDNSVRYGKQEHTLLRAT